MRNSVKFTLPAVILAKLEFLKILFFRTILLKVISISPSTKTNFELSLIVY